MAKKNFLKKTLAIALAATFVLSAAPLAGLCGIALPSLGSVTANAAEEEPVWTDISDMLVVTNNEISLKENAIPSGNIEIPSKINGVAVTKIAHSAFKDCTGITAVKIPDGIKEIGGQAFENCGLETVYFNSNSCVGETDNDFWRDRAPFVKNESLTRFVFGENVNIIPENICCNVNNLQYVEFNYNGAADIIIKDYAFYNCRSLETIDLSKVYSIGIEAFAGCSSLKSVGNGGTEGNLVFGDKLYEIKSSAFNGCTAINELTIPESTEKIRTYAFANCDIKKVYFNAYPCKIEEPTNFWKEQTTFMNNESLTEFVFGKNVSTIPAFVCRNIPSLKKVTILGIINGIGEAAFESCNKIEEIHLASYSEETFNFYALEIGEGNETVTKDIFTFGLKTVDKTNDEFGVTVSYPSNAFDEEVELSVTKVEGGRDDSAVYISDGELFKQTGCFDIKMVLANGSSTNAVQPDGKVTVKMEIPSDYIGKTNIKIVHRLSNGSRENFSFSPRSGEKKLKVSEDKKYWVFEVESFSEFEICEVNPVPSVLIRNNTGSKSIGYGETLRLTANAKNMPADAKIVWYVNDKLEGEGTTFEVSPESGSVKVTVKIVDADGETYAGAEITDSQNVSVKSGFFQKLISFFKNLFGINRIITQMLDVK